MPYEIRRGITIIARFDYYATHAMLAMPGYAISPRRLMIDAAPRRRRDYEAAISADACRHYRGSAYAAAIASDTRYCFRRFFFSPRHCYYCR